MLVRQLVRKLGGLLLRVSEFGKDPADLDLEGERYLEWAWIAAHLPDNPGTVLDFGCGVAVPGLIAALKGGAVTGLDLQDNKVPYETDNLQIRRGDILGTDLGETRFDVIINCSSIEHVGLAGRYESQDVPDGDLIAMGRLRDLLRSPSAIMLLTVPVGRDAVFSPWHRVYGTRRLGSLLQGFHVVSKEFWSKRPGRNTWVQVGEQEALDVRPSGSFYALGFFVLNPEPPQNGS